MKIREIIHREDAAGVGIITKQNTTQDVKPGETGRNLKKLHLTNSVNEVAPTVNYGIGANPGKLVPVGKDGRVPHAKLHVNVNKSTAKKLGIPHEMKENFADGKGPGRPGDSKRAGIPKGASIAQLKKIRSSKTACPRKKQLAHWQINMRQGKKK